MGWCAGTLLTAFLFSFLTALRRWWRLSTFSLFNNLKMQKRVAMIAAFMSLVSLALTVARRYVA